MRRLLHIFSIILGFSLLLPMVLLAAAQAKEKQTLSFNLDALQATMKYDTVKGMLVIDGPISINSPKKPPYMLEMTCHHLLGNSLSTNTATSIIASRKVKFTSIATPKEKDNATPDKKIWPVRYDGSAELVIYEIAPDPETKILSRLLVMKNAKDSDGNDVQPQIIMTHPGQPGDQPMVFSSPNQIIYNMDTGMFKSDGVHVESQDEENQ